MIRSGYMIWKGPDIDNPHWVASCTTMFTSTVLSLLTDDGKRSPDSFAKDFAPDLAAKYASVRLRHLARPTPTG